MFICSDCGNESLKRQGQCNFCKEWNTLKEFKEAKITWSNSNNKWEVKELYNLNNVISENKDIKIKTSSNELNNVLWGWIVPGWVVLLSWEPWIWKSTIALELANLVKEKIIYVSWEETSFQIADRAKRLWVKWDNMLLLAESCIENILETLAKNKTDILIIDSISVMNSNNITWVSWSVSQVRYITELLVAYWKTTNTAIIIIWHVNKDWNLAWPKTLEHMVDTVLFFEWDKFDNLRILRALKNRFWATSEIWIFKMDENWLKDIKNPWLEFVSSQDATIWSSLSITMEWTRPIIIETESLTTYTKFWYPKRSARWINSSKLDLIVAVLWKYTWVTLESHDVYTNISRWLKIEEPWIDLSLAASIISSKTNKILPKNTIFIWEISLTWKVKSINHLEKRVKEAEKMWFTKIITPDFKNSWKNKIEILKISNISELSKKINEL
jgi:DNA repair protein RadA/Sms